MASPIEVNVNPYVRSHGKAPRGHGCWAFEILNSIYFCTDSYSQAIKSAMKTARRDYAKLGRGYTPRIKVLP